MTQSFEILNTADPRVISLLEDTISNSICTFNNANIYELSNDKYLLIPNQYGKYVILYHSKNELDNHIKQECFPIEDYETDSLVEPEKGNIKNIANNICIYIDFIEQKFDIIGNLSNQKKSVESKLELLNNKINSFGTDKLSKYDVLAIGLYCNEIFRIDNDLDWNIDLVLTLNTYWYPNLIDEKNVRYDVAGRIYSSFFDDSFFNLVFDYKSENAKLLGYEPFTEEHIRYINSKSSN